MSAILRVKTLGGEGGIACSDIVAILPDVNSPKEDAIVYTATFPSGLSVKGGALELCAEWFKWFEEVGDED